MNVRSAVPDDAEAIAGICNAISQGLYGEGDVDALFVRQWFEIPKLYAVVAERDGGIAGYVDVRDDDEIRFPIDVRVHPAAAGEGVADALVVAAEEWARSRTKRTAVARGYVGERDAELRGAFERAGYALIRHSFQMHIELPERIEPPEWPDGISVRTFEPSDEVAVYECAQESFADHWDFHRAAIDEWRIYNVTGERFDPTLLWLAEDDGELAGVCLNHWHVSGDMTYGWIGTLGVRRPWRKRGLGRALLLHSFADFKRRGATRVGLGVDAENTTGAVRLYESVGMRAVRRNDTYEKQL